MIAQPNGRVNGTAKHGPTIHPTPDLSAFLRDDVYPRLDADQIYTWHGHAFHKSNGKWRGSCPWHKSDSGTSFDVSLDSGLWWCQGCGIGGDPLNYLWRLKGRTGNPTGQDFVGLVRDLAQLAGVPFPERERTAEEVKVDQQRASRQSALETVYRKCLEWLWTPAGDLARAYLHERGLTDDAIRNLELGLYLDAGELKRLLAKVGHATTSNEGVIEALEGYIVFPWRDEYGRALTIYGRWPAKIPPDGKPKTYALPGEGSKRSPFYYDRVRKAGHADPILVEGVLDAAVLQAYGETNVCAYVGGQPSLAQLETLKHHKVRSLTICPDPDAGGDSGIRSFLRNVDSTIRAYVAPPLPDGKDPDELVLSEGLDAWRAHVGRAVRGWAYEAERILTGYELAGQRGRDDALLELAELAGRLTSQRDLDELVLLTAKRTKLKSSLFSRDFKQAYAEGQTQRSEVPPAEPTPKPTDSTPVQPIPLADLLATFRKWLYLDDTGGVEVALATVVANRADGDPVWLLIVSPPGGGKTEAIMPLSDLPDVHMAATLTEGSLLSGTAKKETARGATGGILRQVGDQGIILVKDFSGLLSLNKDTRGPVLSALREIYDGAWARPVGTDGGRVLEWRGKAGLIGGATPAIDGYHATMAALGERFAFYRLAEDKRDERTQKALANVGMEPAMRAELSKAARSFFVGLPAKPAPAPLTETERTWLVRLADLAVLCRSSVDRDAYSPSKEIVDVLGAEMPTRFVKVLAQLRLGLLTIGVEEERAWQLIRKVAFDSIPKARRKAVDFLARQPARMTTRAVALTMGLPTKTVGRALEELLCYGVVQRESKETTTSDEDTGRGADYWVLSAWARDAYNLVAVPPGGGESEPQSREGENTDHEDASKDAPPGGEGGVSSRDTQHTRSRVCGSDPGTPPAWGCPDSPDPDDPLAVLTAWAELLDWPELRIRPGTKIRQGRECWQKFLAFATPDQLTAAIEATEREGVAV